MIHAWRIHVYYLFNAYVKLSFIKFLVSGDMAQVVDPTHVDLKVAGSVPL